MTKSVPAKAAEKINWRVLNCSQVFPTWHSGWHKTMLIANDYDDHHFSENPWFFFCVGVATTSKKRDRFIFLAGNDQCARLAAFYRHHDCCFDTYIWVKNDSRPRFFALFFGLNEPLVMLLLPSVLHTVASSKLKVIISYYTDLAWNEAKAFTFLIFWGFFFQRIIRKLGTWKPNIEELKYQKHRY